MSTPIQIIIKKVSRKAESLLRQRFYRILAGFRPTYSRTDWKSKVGEKFRSLHGSSCSESKPSIADSIYSHVFNLLGSGPVNVCYGLKAGGFEDCKYTALNVDIEFDQEGVWLERFINKANIGCSRKVWQLLRQIDSDYEPIDWQIDFVSGYRWDNNVFYKDIKIGDKKGVDIKVPWELSRFQHLSSLALAYRVTNEEKYAKEYICQILDWIAANPPMFGANWACTMDVAIRVANWLFWFGYIRDWLEIQTWRDGFYNIFLNSIYDHLKFISKNLERTESLTTNHYLANIAGLSIVASSTEEIFAESRHLKLFSMSELKKEMFKQFYPDGTNFEASTCYHRLGIEIVFYAVLWEVVCNSNFRDTNYREVAEIIFGLEFVERLHKSFDVVLHLLKPNGKMPQIGDNDSGQFIKLWHRDVLDMRYILALGAVFFRDSKFKIREFFQTQDDIEETKVLYGAKGGCKLWDSMNSSTLTDVKSVVFIDSGWYIMRNAMDYCIISCGPNGQNKTGGHCHNDKLSFELCINGYDVVVDPGTYVYTASQEARNRFRGTAFHNTVVVDGQEQRRFNPDNLFTLANDVMPRCLKWETGEDVDIFIGENYWSRLAQPVVHKREIRFCRKLKNLLITDIFEGKGDHDLEWNIILLPEFNGELRVDSAKVYWQKESAFYSAGYGLMSKTARLHSNFKATLPFTVTLSINIFDPKGSYV